MDHEYKILKTGSGIIECYESQYAKLIAQYNERGIVSRPDVLREFGGESLKLILSRAGFSGDIQKGLDMIVRDILVSIDNVAMEKSDLIESACSFLNQTCERTEKSRLEYKGRKLCGKRDYTTDCKTIILRKI